MKHGLAVHGIYIGVEVLQEVEALTVMRCVAAAKESTIDPNESCLAPVVDNLGCYPRFVQLANKEDCATLFFVILRPRFGPCRKAGVAQRVCPAAKGFKLFSVKFHLLQGNSINILHCSIFQHLPRNSSSTHI
ncbi:unnamed protein product [Polarella glacialis]|uniref:Uncharacterized protein n=1 Tax=Polarella glacialis TaxID=89957 RepID=A0A813HND4_POLGL|nr:unnamed protein product [Polarella glacialis]